METATAVSNAVDSIELASYQKTSSPYNFVQSAVRQSSDIRQDTEFARLLDRVQTEYNDNQLVAARECINQAPSSFQSTFDLQLLSLKIHIRLGNIDQAVALFINLHAENMQNHQFLLFLLELADTTERMPLQDHTLALFGHLPPLYQRSVLDYAIDYYVNQDQKFQASYLMVYYMKRFSRLESDYIIRAIELTLETERDNSGPQCRSFLVRDVLPLLLKHKLELVSGDGQRVKIEEKAVTIVLGRDYFLQLLRKGQSYYANEFEWEELSVFTSHMLNLCRFDAPSYVSVEKFAADLTDARHNLLTNLEPRSFTSALHIMEYENAAVIAKLFQLSMKYYQHICSSDDSTEEKACLIPICALRQITPPPQAGTTKREPPNEDTVINNNGKRVRSTQDEDSQSSLSMLNISDVEQPQLKKQRECPDDISSSKDVDDALHILNSAAFCFRHLAETSRWANEESSSINHFDWDIAMRQYDLSFVLYNAMLLLRSDLALVNPKEAGNLSTALKLNQELCDRIEAQRRKEKLGTEKESLVHDIPFMFAFRVLYTISIIYLLVGSIQQSTMEVAIILSVFPISRGLTEEDFEVDEIECRRAIEKFQGREFGMMRMTQQGFVTRCIKHLVVGLDVEAEQRGGMASIDAAMRWDEKAGNIMVLMQYGWPYWKEKTQFWNRIVQHMKEKKVLKNRTFLEHIHVPDILNTLLWLQDSADVTLDVIPRDMVISGESFDQSAMPTTAPNSPRQPHMILENAGSPSSASNHLPSLSSLPLLHYNKTPQAPKMYEPPSINTILPSMSMSPTWYSASFQKGADAQWMSPSFYYSRPATSVLLLSRPRIEPQRASWHQPNTSKAMVTRYLTYKVQKLSPKATPHKMRHVLQRFLKSLIARNDKAT